MNYFPLNKIRSTSGTYKLWISFSLLFIICLGVFRINQPYYGDEYHFVQTIRLFGSTSWPLIFKDYPEVTTPLTYIIFAAWGKIFGFELYTLRLLLLIISFIFLLILYRMIFLFERNEKRVLLLCIVIMLNPYMWGLSIFVFTDMLMLLFLITAVYSFGRNYYLIAAVLLGLAILCRQYSLIFAVGLWLYLLVQGILKSDYKIFIRFTSVLVICLIPFVILMILWGGMSPPSGRRLFIVQDSFFWNPHGFVTYVSFSAIYIFPLIVINYRKLINYKRLLFPSIFFSIIYLLFPVQVSEVTKIQVHLDTVGLIHKLIHYVFGSGLIGNVVLYFYFIIGIWLLLVFLSEDTKNLKLRVLNNNFLFTLIIFLFLTVMPFSYQIWEKYLVMIIPLLVLRFDKVREFTKSYK